MVCNFVELLNFLDVRTNDGCLTIEDADSAEDLHVAHGFVLEVLQGLRHLTRPFLVESYLMTSCVVIDLKVFPHCFLMLACQSSNKNHLSKG